MLWCPLAARTDASQHIIVVRIEESLYFANVEQIKCTPPLPHAAFVQSHFLLYFLTSCIVLFFEFGLSARAAMFTRLEQRGDLKAHPGDRPFGSSAVQVSTSLYLFLSMAYWEYPIYFP
jgi:hypothetical protein